MGWMVGKSGYTMQTERLNLGRSPNIEIKAKETTINNVGGYGNFGIDTPIFSYGQSYPGGINVQQYDPGLSKAEKWMLGIGGVTTLLGIGLSAFTGNKKSVADAPDTSNSELRTQIQQQEQQIAEKNQKLVAARRENAELKEASKLYQEGITKNDDGTYSKTIKGADGKDVTITGATPDEVRTKANASSAETEEALQLQQEGITKNADGTYSKTTKGPDGKEVTVTGNSPEEVRYNALLVENGIAPATSQDIFDSVTPESDQLNNNLMA